MDGFCNVLTLNLLRSGEVGNSPRNFKYPNKDLLYTTYEYSEVVSVVTIKWDELVGIGV